MHRACLRTQRFDVPLLQSTFEAYLHALEDVEARLESLELISGSEPRQTVIQLEQTSRPPFSAKLIHDKPPVHSIHLHPTTQMHGHQTYTKEAGDSNIASVRKEYYTSDTVRTRSSCGTGSVCEPSFQECFSRTGAASSRQHPEPAKRAVPWREELPRTDARTFDIALNSEIRINYFVVMTTVSIPTIRDVAHHARVSIKTVSRVINKSPLVSPETSARVQEAIRALDFHPHSSARNLAGRRAHAVAVCIPLTVEHVFAHTFFFQTLQGVAEVLQQHDYELVLHARPDVHSFLPLWKERRVDALILMSVPIRDPRIFELKQARVPFILTCRPDESNSDLDRMVGWVDADHTEGAENATSHLLSIGHRRIAFINGPGNLMVSRLREAGFRQAFARHGLDSAEMPIFSGDFSVESGRTLGEQLLGLSARPTGVFCADDTLAIGVIQAATKRGLSVPADLSIVGFDDITLSRYLEPPLTTVRQPAEAKGRLAATEVLRLLDSATDRKARHHLLATELVIRRSTAPPCLTGETIMKTDTGSITSVVSPRGAAAPDKHVGVCGDPRRRS